MPKPHVPNTNAATRASVAARARRVEERKAAELRATGWTVVPPAVAQEVRPEQRCPTCGGELDWTDDQTGTCIDEDCGDET